MEKKAQPNMTVYHGTDKRFVRNIYEGVQISRLEKGDFNQSQTGRAFYATVDETYAEDWAIKTHKDEAAVIQFEVVLGNLEVKKFPENKKDIGQWQTFVAKNWLDKKRNKKDKGEVHDVVAGFVSNADDVWEGKGEDYVPQKTLYQPVVHRNGFATQVAFCTDKAIDKDHLVFKSYKTYDEGQEEWSTYTKNLTKLSK